MWESSFLRRILGKLCGKKICLFQFASGLSDPKGDAAKINGTRSYRTGSKANTLLWLLLGISEMLQRLPCHQRSSENCWQKQQKGSVVTMRLSGLMGSEYSERNYSFPIKSTSWSCSLQQLKVTGLSTGEKSSSGSRDGPHTAQGQPKPHLNWHFLLSQSFLTHFQLTKLFPWEEKEDPSDCWHLIRGFLALEALEVRAERSSYHQLHQALLNCPHHNSPPCCSEGQLGTKPAQHQVAAQTHSQVDPQQF